MVTDHLRVLVQWYLLKTSAENRLRPWIFSYNNNGNNNNNNNDYNNIIIIFIQGYSPGIHFLGWLTQPLVINSPRSIYEKILTWLQGFRVKIANFSQLHCLAVSRDLSTNKTRSNIEKWPDSLEVVLD